jgi:hypothetical protein
MARNKTLKQTEEKEQSPADRCKEVSKYNQLYVPHVKVSQGTNGSLCLELTVADAEWLKQVFASNSEPFMNEMILQLLNNVLPNSTDKEIALKNGLALVAAVKPKDELESMLAVQMAAIHMATMTFSRRLANIETIEQQDSAERALNKLARTFTTQMEALKRYRTGGEQKVTVHHVTVNEGGQAIVGTVEQSKNQGG